VYGNGGDRFPAAQRWPWGCASRVCRLPHWLRGLDARLVLHCHDELLLDCAEQDAPEAETALTGCMTEAWQRLFPEAVMLGICEAQSGHSWGEAKG